MSTAIVGPGQRVSATFPARATALAPAATVGMASQSTIHPPPRRAAAMTAVIAVVPYTARAGPPP